MVLKVSLSTSVLTEIFSPATAGAAAKAGLADVLCAGAELLLAGRLAAASCAEAGALAVTAGFLPKENMGVLPLYSSHWFQIMKREANKTAPKMVRRVSLFMGG